jgi:hypothetical protein
MGGGILNYGVPAKPKVVKATKTVSEALGLVNYSIHRAVLDVTGDFLAALVVEFIHYRFIKNDRKPVWMKIDFIHKNLPYISRAGLAKKLKKLITDGHILETKGKGRQYHKCWYAPSPDMREACSDTNTSSGKVYYNKELAKEDVEASVIYATITHLLNVDDKLMLDTAKLVEGSGLSLGQVRRAVKWLIDNKKIEAKKVFGNKREVSIPANAIMEEADVPTESYHHFDPADDEPTERFPHKS